MTPEQESVASVIALIFRKALALLQVEFLGIEFWAYISGVCAIYLAFSFFSSHSVGSVFRINTPSNKTINKVFVTHEYGDKHWHK